MSIIENCCLQEGSRAGVKPSPFSLLKDCSAVHIQRRTSHQAISESAFGAVVSILSSALARLVERSAASGEAAGAGKQGGNKREALVTAATETNSSTKESVSARGRAACREEGACIPRNREKPGNREEAPLGFPLAPFARGMTTVKAQTGALEGGSALPRSLP